MHWRFSKLDQQSLGTTNRGKLALLEISFRTGKVTATGLLNYHWVVKRYLVHSWQGFLSQSVATFISNLRFFTINKKDFMEWISQMGRIRLIEFKTHRLKLNERSFDKI